MFDSHCHIDSPRLAPDQRDAMIARAAAAGVKALVIPGVEPEGWPEARRLAAEERRLRIFAACGVHPQILPEIDEAALDAGLEAVARAAAQAVAVGECGFDGPSLDRPGGEMSRQWRAASAQFDAACEADRPVIVHCLKAHEAFLQFLKERRHLPRSIILHSYSGGAELLREYLKFPTWFSIAGPITYKNARRAIAAARAIPRERLLVETDAPDQTPEPYRSADGARGQANEPAYLRVILEAVAQVRSEGFEALAEATAAHAAAAFGVEQP